MQRSRKVATAILFAMSAAVLAALGMELLAGGLGTLAGLLLVS